MKTNLLSFGTLLIATCTSDIFAQGTIIFGNHIPGSVVAPIYGPEPTRPWLVLQGNDVFGLPPGTVLYTGQLLSTADNVTVQLWGGASASSLAPVLGAEATIAKQGFFATLSTPVTIAGVPPGSMAYLELRAWQNQSGILTSWDQAYAAALVGNEAVGQSSVFLSQALGGGIIPPANMYGLTTFNIHTIPEPSTLALAGLGAVLLVLFRCRSTWLFSNNPT
jgi:hypothetical protein